MSNETSATGSSSSGVEGRKVYVDAIEQALERSARATGKDRKPSRSHRSVVDQLRRRLLDAEKLERLQRKQIEDLRKECREDKMKRLDAAFVNSFVALTTASNNLAEQIRRCVEAERKAIEGLEDDQLDEVLRSHLPRLAGGMVEGDKRAMLETWFGVDVTNVLLAGPQGGVQ